MRQPVRPAREPFQPCCRQRRLAAPRSSSPWRSCRVSGFCTVAAPAWAPPYAQVPRPGHMRRGNNDAAPSRCERYAIRCFLLTDSVAYAPLLISCHVLWLGGDGISGVRGGIWAARLPTGHPPPLRVLHLSTPGASGLHAKPSRRPRDPRFHLLEPDKCANNVQLLGVRPVCSLGDRQAHKFAFTKNVRTGVRQDVCLKGQSAKHQHLISWAGLSGGVQEFLR